MSIKQKLKDQEVKGEIKFFLRVIGSILVALSGFILLIDKVTSSIKLDNNFGYSDTETFLWVLGQTLSPLLILLASLFKPFRTSYLIPIYIYSIQLYWVFKPNVRFDNVYLQAYAVGSCVFFLLLLLFIYWVNSLKLKREKEEEFFQFEVRNTIELLKKEVLSKSE